MVHLRARNAKFITNLFMAYGTPEIQIIKMGPRNRGPYVYEIVNFGNKFSVSIFKLYLHDFEKPIREYIKI